MPLTRYQSRNEYGLADPDLYQSADKDDPEALLEGVAMAGLVGILRQLGDLAEFAAEMFHDLHEEVMATASRSHGLMARVQQLESEFPFIEKSLLCQTDHTPFFSNKGVEWRPNLQLEQSVVTRGDLPRCVMDSYEECRGPPRLFLLDKFDISGAGACLKRYTDPSFVKLEISSYETSWDDIQREKKSQKAKRRASHLKNGGTPENALSSHAKLHELFLEEHLEAHQPTSDQSRAVKLKTRKLDGYSLISKSGESYMEKFVQTPVDNHTGYQIITPTPEWNTDSTRNGVAVTNIPEVGKVASLENSRNGSISEMSLSNEEETVVNAIEKDIETVPESTHNVTNGKLGFIQHRSYSEDLTSEADNYVDAPATMESENETDDECRPKNKSEAVEDVNISIDDQSEGNKASHLESVSSSNVVGGQTSFRSNGTCSSPRAVSQNGSLTAQSLAPEVVETGTYVVNEGNNADPIGSSSPRSCASFDAKNSNFASETSSISSVEKKYMVDDSSNVVNSDTIDSQTDNQLPLTDDDVETNSIVDEVCSKDDELDCDTVAKEVAEVASEHSNNFGVNGDVSVSESHEDTLENGIYMPSEVDDSKLTSDFNSGVEELVEDDSPTCSKRDEHTSDDGFHDRPGLDNAAPKVELDVSDNHTDTSSEEDVDHAVSLSSTGSLPWISTNRSSSKAEEVCHDTVVDPNETLPAENNPDSEKESKESQREVSSEGSDTENDDMENCEPSSPISSLDQSESILVDNYIVTSPENATIKQSEVQTSCESHAFVDEEPLQSNVSESLEFVPQPQVVELDSPNQELLNQESTFPGFGLFHESLPLDQEEMPPLPPLPPMQWRIGKASQSSFPSFMESSFESSTSSSSTPPVGYVKSEQLPEELVNNALEKPLQSSIQFPTIDTDLDSQHDSSVSQITQPSKLLTTSDHEIIEEISSEENNHSQDPSAKYEDSKHDTDIHAPQSIETKDLMMPTESTKKEDKDVSVRATSNAEAGESSNTSVEKILVGGAMWPVSAFTTAPTLEDTYNKPEEVHMVRLPRPRSPLVDAVAAHDRRTMKKVSERVQPPIKSNQEDKDSLLAQIRNKSINLKPAVSTRPSIQTGPKTNLRVAAILEKANTIRQAMAGSDEDEDSDSWSDS